MWRFPKIRPWNCGFFVYRCLWAQQKSELECYWQGIVLILLQILRRMRRHSCVFWWYWPNSHNFRILFLNVTKLQCFEASLNTTLEFHKKQARCKSSNYFMMWIEWLSISLWIIWIKRIILKPIHWIYNDHFQIFPWNGLYSPSRSFHCVKTMLVLLSVHLSVVFARSLRYMHT